MVRFGIKAKSHRHRRFHAEEIRLIIPDQFITSVYTTYPTEVLVPIPNFGFADVEQIIGVPMAAVIQKVPGVVRNYLKSRLHRHPGESRGPEPREKTGFRLSPE
jgi:hypothetical protein